MFGFCQSHGDDLGVGEVLCPELFYVTKLNGERLPNRMTPWGKGWGGGGAGTLSPTVFCCTKTKWGLGGGRGELLRPKHQYVVIHTGGGGGGGVGGTLPVMTAYDASRVGGGGDWLYGRGRTFYSPRTSF